MGDRNDYYSDLFNGRPPKRDSGYASSSDTNVPALPRNSSSNSLTFSMSLSDDDLPTARRESSPEVVPASTEITQSTTVLPSVFIKGFKEGGIEVHVPGVVHGVFSPPEGMKVQFRLPQEGDTEEKNMNLFIKAGLNQIDYYKDRCGEIQSIEPVNDCSETKQPTEAKQLYSNYFNGDNSNQSNNPDTESDAGSNTDSVGGNPKSNNLRTRCNTY
ncbi:unnamed protein product [Rodentolepis nana]|uniref:ZU5 domain-containing protein n=1 Tax=Rodentolepis nana TaxID=102285 RepID=A0A0R3T0U1_RODNA|nr:unnamed protein product [Rodentolepis nana]